MAVFSIFMDFLAAPGDTERTAQLAGMAIHDPEHLAGSHPVLQPCAAVVQQDEGLSQERPDCAVPDFFEDDGAVAAVLVDWNDQTPVDPPSSQNTETCLFCCSSDRYHNP